MVKHIILWTLNPELSEEEKKQVKAGIKAGLEGLLGKVPGLIDVKVHIDARRRCQWQGPPLHRAAQLP